MATGRTLADATRDERGRIKIAVDKLISSLADSCGLCREAVANIAFYCLQRHADCGRNATKKQKRASYAHWDGRCKKCNEPVSFEDAKFHHVKRGIPNQHEPDNLVPEHEKCHDEEHNVKKGSLSKGSPVRRNK
jgi:hypothetical protein